MALRVVMRGLDLFLQRPHDSASKYQLEVFPQCGELDPCVGTQPGLRHQALLLE